MNRLHRIKGIDKLLKNLPAEYQHWNKFGNIIEFNYKKEFDFDELKDIDIIEMLLADDNEKYKIKIQLRKVRGTVEFDILNGFFSGFTIEDYNYAGYEKPNFLITSCEQDVSFELFCDDIIIELQ